MRQISIQQFRLDDDSGRAFLEMTMFVPLFFLMSMMAVEYSIWFREAQNMAYMSREMVNGGIRKCGTTETFKTCFGDPDIPMYQQSTNLMMVHHKLHLTLRSSISINGNIPSIVITPWHLDTTTNEVKPYMPYGYILLAGSCPPDAIHSRFDITGRDTWGTNEICNPPIGGGDGWSPLAMPKFNPDQDADFEALVRSRGIAVTAETFYWYHPVTKIGEWFFADKAGVQEFVYHAMVI